MTDTLSPSQRSEMMSRIRGRDTKPELQVRSILHRMGYRFTLDNRDMPGSPDIVLPRYDVAIFVHGCFWHRHEGCRYATTPKTRRSFWNAKFQANIARDRRVTAALRRDGWRVWTVWECQLRAPEKVASRLQRMLERVSAGY
ncbi:MAG: very short patch repair endonuclease [Phycisphaerae bacterium]|nr:very short patch repair endonuclease [Phycisphaerae bacterium]